MDNDDTPITFISEIITVLERQSELIEEQQKEIDDVRKKTLSLVEKVKLLEKDNTVDPANEGIVLSLISRLKAVSDKLGSNLSE
ncbi:MULTISPECIES: hypothetical protein [unclassified Microcoleus]|uniref:hypothetical protein n=1 Tax=unclassified Microcoleus TaxID=2642155 RepID=UPI002FD29A23